MSEISASTRYKIKIRDKFNSTDEDSEKMHVQLARICVLYQDILIELDGAAAADELDALRHSDAKSRRFYFVRRALASSWEMKQAVDVLQMNKSFKALRANMSKDNQKLWDSAAHFFQANQADLKEWRNDQGGHFSDGAAKYAINEMPSQLEDELVVFKQGEGAGAMMPFAYQLVAVALSKYRKPTEDYEQHFNRMFTLMKDSHTHAVRIGHVITAEHLLKT